MNAKPQVSPHLDKACYPEPNVVTESGGRLRASSPVEGFPLSELLAQAERLQADIVAAWQDNPTAAWRSHIWTAAERAAMCVDCLKRGVVR